MSDASGAISGDDEEDEAAMEQELRRRMQESICSASAQRNTIKKQARVICIVFNEYYKLQCATWRTLLLAFEE